MENFDQDIPAIINVSEPHFALCFLVDTSKSMSLTQNGGTPPINALNEGFAQFKNDIIENDSILRNILDVAVIEFNDTHKVVQDFFPIEYLRSINLIANGGTMISPAIKEALKIVRNRTQFYARLGTASYKPWVILISDGVPNDDVTEVAQEINERTKAGKLHFFSVGLPGCNLSTLHLLSGSKVMIIKDSDFTSFFKWLKEYAESGFVARAYPNEIKSIDLPENIVIDIVNDWDW